MPMGDTYIALTRYLKDCGLDEITMTFSQIAEIVGRLPKSAYDYTAPWYDGHGGPLSHAWINAGYSTSGVIRGKQVTFIKSGIVPGKINRRESNTFIQPAYKVQLNVETAVTNIRKYHETTTDGLHTRYRSWAHCYKAFRENRHNAEKADFLCLHLAWYLASWGMLRNSFLLNRDYLVHMPLINEIMSGRFEPLFQDEHTAEMIPLTMEATEEIKNVYSGNSVTDTLITKILLGVFGCAPAYDDYFRYAARKHKVCSGSWNKRSIRSLWQYYECHREAFEKLRHEFVVEGLRYTPMKLLDMCLWQIGFDELER